MRSKQVSGPRTLLAALAALGLMAALTMPALANHVDPTFVAENANSCEDLGLTGEGWNLNAGDVSEGTHTYTKGEWTITITADASMHTFDFSDADPTVLKIAVKAGDGYYLYDYSPTGAASDTGLITPNNSGNDPQQPQAGLSHFMICFGGSTPSEEESPSMDESPSQEESPSMEESPSQEESQSEAASASPAATGGVEGGNPTPGGGLPNTAMGDFGQVPATVLSLVFLGALGAMVFVRLARER